MSRVSPVVDLAQVLARTEAWLTRAVIGLNLCPFAKAVHVKGQIHCEVTLAQDDEALRDALAQALRELVATDPAVRDTTLLVVPAMLADFLDFNDFLGAADAVLDELRLSNEIQIASFHPRYQFAGTAADDIGNFTNRAPYPILHLLREASVGRAVDAFPDTDAIYENNIATLERLGAAGWAALDVGPVPQDPPASA